MSNPNTFPDATFPFEYWVLEYWPLSYTTVVADVHGCVDLNDWLNYDVTILDEAIHNAVLSDTSHYDVTIIDVICPN